MEIMVEYSFHFTLNVEVLSRSIGPRTIVL